MPQPLVRLGLDASLQWNSCAFRAEYNIYCIGEALFII